MINESSENRSKEVPAFEKRLQKLGLKPRITRFCKWKNGSDQQAVPAVLNEKYITGIPIRRIKKITHQITYREICLPVNAMIITEF
jgi:hypothetical protein